MECLGFIVKGPGDEGCCATVLAAIIVPYALLDMGPKALCHNGAMHLSSAIRW